MKALVKYKNGNEEEFTVHSTIEVCAIVNSDGKREFVEFPHSSEKEYYLDECEITLKAD